MVDNFSQIKGLMNFEDENDFYFVQILQRRKDGKQGQVDPPERPTRVVKVYSIRSHEHLDEKKQEITTLCDVFGARAQLNVNKRNFKKCALATLRDIADLIDKENYSKVARSFNSSCGRYSSEEKKNKKWIIDIDPYEIDADPHTGTIVQKIVDEINEMKPDGDKLVDVIPSLNGVHMVTTPFDLQSFEINKPYDVGVHKDAFTNLYIP